MDEIINQWCEEIDQNTAMFKEAFGHMSDDELNAKPNPETWSIAQNIDHIITINESFYPLIKKHREGNLKLPFMSRFGFFNRMMGNFIYNSSTRERKKKIKTFPVWEPAQSDIPNALVSLEKHHEEFKQFIRDCKDLLEQGIIVHSPASDKISYELSKAFEIMIVHEKRHFDQAREMAANL